MHPPANSSGAVMIMGLCSLLGSSASVVGALSLGLALFLALLITSVLLTATRRVIPLPLHAATVVVFFTGSVTTVQLVIAATRPVLYVDLGPFLPLLAAGGLLLPFTALFTREQGRGAWIANATRSGAAFVALATVLGGIRELAGHGVPIGVLLPGSLLSLGLIAALYKGIASRMRSS